MPGGGTAQAAGVGVANEKLPWPCPWKPRAGCAGRAALRLCVAAPRRALRRAAAVTGVLPGVNMLTGGVNAVGVAAALPPAERVMLGLDAA